MLRFITGLDVTLCQSLSLSLSTSPLKTSPPSSLSPSHTLSSSRTPSLSFFSSAFLRHPPPFLSISAFFYCVSPSVVSAAVLNRGLFVHKHALSWPLPYLLVSRAAVALLCVIAQPCLFSLPRSCLSWLWTSFKACPVSAPRQTLTHAHTHTNTVKGRVHTSIKMVFTGQRIHTVPMWAGHKCTQKKRIHTQSLSLFVPLWLHIYGFSRGGGGGEKEAVKIFVLKCKK